MLKNKQTEQIKASNKRLEGPKLLDVAVTAALVEGSWCMKIKDDIRRVACTSHLRIFCVPEETEEPSPGMTSQRAVYW